MKTLKLFFALWLIFIATNIDAQENSASKPVLSSRATNAATPEDLAKRMQIRITRILRLEPETSNKLYTPSLEYFRQKQNIAGMEARTAESGLSAAKTNSSELAKLREIRENAFKQILGDSRYAELQQYLQNLRKQVEDGKYYTVNPDAILLDN
ncbi:MAG: hypothetical protein RMJ53_06530 [Chitinophagales bacterium]|nr:hypothetical protein [Chitinophagales bacterium]MDW8273866.1 hypothetical protein [Chitinophagales bacterium]